MNDITLVVSVTHIKYDGPRNEVKGLPKSLNLSIELDKDHYKECGEADIVDLISNAISNETDWLVEDFTIKDLECVGV